MPFTLEHTVATKTLDIETHDGAQGIYFTVSATDTFEILYPGRLYRLVSATVRHSMRIDVQEPSLPTTPTTPDGVPTHPTHPTTPPPLHNGVTVTAESLTLDFRIYDPDGKEFTADEVTLADLQKFRDQRGRPVGRWSYRLSGQSRVYVLNPAVNETVGQPEGSINLVIVETVQSGSAPPLLSKAPIVGEHVSLPFDLYRVGSFVATVTSPFIALWNGSMRLLDPDGVEFAKVTGRTLRCHIPLSALGKSRDVHGKPRPWTLEVTSIGPQIGHSTVTATVIGEGRIGTEVIRQRIDTMLGEHGKFIDLHGENSGGRALAILRILDVVAAETIDMHGILDSVLKKNHESTDVFAFKSMIVGQGKSDYSYGISLDVSSLKLSSIDVTIGASKHLGAQTPAIRLDVRVDGELTVQWEGHDLASAGLDDGRLELEIGVQIDPDGTPRVVTWVTDEPFDIDFSAAVIALMVAIPLLGLTAEAVKEYVEDVVNDDFVKGVKGAFDDPGLAPKILMTLMGTHLSYLSPRIDGSDLLFEHVAPLEPDPRPRPDYAGAIGRTLLEEAVGHVSFVPMTLGDTWKADNLKSKVDHIVVVMMENRSYDHVLGYRALPPVSDGANGWTTELMDVVNATMDPNPPAAGTPEAATYLPPVHPLRKSAFAPNSLGLRTMIPRGVGHELDDVTRQLSGVIDGPGHSRINDPNGFVDDFREKKLHGKVEGEDGVIPWDVLGYYEKNEAEGANDLPIYAFLAENYGYCDRYFCSHPGPTLPNRMYSLTGDVQYDRLGVPILDNNHGDNFLLSRAQTIYDVLTQHGVSWRVYESFPSVTMLRMFARYATDNEHIRKLDELENDIATQALPALTVIEPAMHHYPEDDDHPPWDMYRGQMFIRRVYETLRKSPQWEKTLLIITYDEHGGLYDHVIPPIADVLNVPAPSTVSDGGGGPVVGGMSDGGGSGSGTSGGGVGGGHHHPWDWDNHIPPEWLNVVLGDAATTTPASAKQTIHVQYGVRVPTFVVSPWVSQGKCASIVLDHCSVLKTILARFCGEAKPFMSDRIAASLSFESLLSEPQPRPDPGHAPELGNLDGPPAPTPLSKNTKIVTPPVFRKQLREEQVDAHEITGRLARMLGR